MGFSMDLSSALSPIVMVHGAWHGAWCWAKLQPLLREQGLTVYVPTQTGVGEKAHLLSMDISLATFVDDIVQVLETHDLQHVVLVGHSFGGISISGVADRIPHRIRRLVYLDALLLHHGQSVFDILPPDMVAARRQLARQSSGGLSLPPPDPQVLGVTDAEDAAWVKAHCTPHPVSTYEGKMHLNHPLGNGLPATYIAVTPHYLPTTSSRDHAKSRPDWQYVEMPAGHDAMVTSPAHLSRLLVAMAQPPSS